MAAQELENNLITQLGKIADSYLRSRAHLKEIYMSFTINKETIEKIISMCYLFSIENFDYQYTWYNTEIDSIKLQGIFNNSFFQTKFLSPSDAITFLFKLYSLFYTDNQEGIAFILSHLDDLSVSNKFDPNNVENYDTVRGHLDVVFKISAARVNDFISAYNEDMRNYDPAINPLFLLNEAIDLRSDCDDELINYIRRPDYRQNIYNQYEYDLATPPREQEGRGIGWINRFTRDSLNINRIFNIRNNNLTFNILNLL